VNTPVRPDGSPTFVHRSAHARYALAASFTVGRTVLDVGAGTTDDAAPLSTLPGLRDYAAADADPPPGSSVVPARLPADVDRLAPADTVVALEVVEHVDPADQTGFLAACWTLTRHRLILSTPDPEAGHRYPATEWWFGVGNPDHTREPPPAILVRYLVAACPGGLVRPLIPYGLDVNDYLVVDPLHAAAGWFAIVDRVDSETAP
jgi:hypothetical protein